MYGWLKVYVCMWLNVYVCVFRCESIYFTQYTNNTNKKMQVYISFKVESFLFIVFCEISKTSNKVKYIIVNLREKRNGFLRKFFFCTILKKCEWVYYVCELVSYINLFEIQFIFFLYILKIFLCHYFYVACYQVFYVT